MYIYDLVKETYLNDINEILAFYSLYVHLILAENEFWYICFYNQNEDFLFQCALECFYYYYCYRYYDFMNYLEILIRKIYV